MFKKARPVLSLAEGKAAVLLAASRMTRPLLTPGAYGLVREDGKALRTQLADFFNIPNIVP